MGTIVKRRRKDGSVRFLAQIIIKREGQVVHQEAKSHDNRYAAILWMEKREAEIASGGLLEKPEVYDPLFSDIIDKYIDGSQRDFGRTKRQVLLTVARSSFGRLRASEITSQEVTSFIAELGKDKKPQTVMNYMSHLSGIFAIAKPAWGAPLDKQAFDEAMSVAKRMGTVRKSGKRDRRPTLEELDALLTYFSERSIRYPDSAPMVKIIIFALFSTRRQEEITRITWKDLEKEENRVLVRDMKHPGQKIGNDQWCDLVPEAMAVIETMPKTAEQIFPYTADAISASFTRACQVLGIDDLHFHDLRHEGVSRLAELGWSIPHIAAVSGHRSWQSLNRYSHIRKKGDKYDGWPWLEKMTAETKKDPAAGAAG